MERRAAVLFSLLFGVGCGPEPEGVPEGKLARVGPRVIGPEDVAAAKSQVGAYGQLRFSGAEGAAAMLEALIAAELLAQEADEAGLGDDPRVQFAVDEEIAAVYLSTLLERRVPRRAVEQDAAALRAYYDGHRADFTEPERRSAQGVVFESFPEAERALAELRMGVTTLEGLGAVVATPLQVRNDAEYAAFHPILFAAGVGEGDWMPHPVFVGESLLVGRVQTVESAQLQPFEDPAVRERLVAAVLAPRREAARVQIVAELAAREAAVQQGSSRGGAAP